MSMPVLLESEQRHEELLAAYEPVINLPDLHFYKWCDKTYGINRGVYNTLDLQLYENGHEDLFGRRLFIICFLSYLRAKDAGSERLRFGKGGLAETLSAYIAGQSAEIIN